MPSPEFDRLLALIRARPPVPGLTLAQIRINFDAMFSRKPLPDDVIREGTVIGGRPAERLSTPGAERDRVVLYLHGGAYGIGSIQSHRELASRVSRAAGAPVVVVDYRLAPEHPFPAALDDATAAYRDLLAQGFAPGRVAVVGDSAGGGLGIATLLALRDAGTALPGAVVCLSGWFDLALESESLKRNAATDPTLQREILLPYAERYLGSVDAKHPLASPVYADLKGLPPMLLQVATAETLQDDSVRLVDRARALGVDVTLDPYGDMIHVFQAHGMLPESLCALERIGTFVRGKTATRGS